MHVSKIALDYLTSLNEKTKERIKASLKELEIDPYKPRPKADIKKLHGHHKPEFYRIRTGDFRAIYTISGNKIMVTEIMPRSKGYEWLD